MTHKNPLKLKASQKSRQQIKLTIEEPLADYRMAQHLSDLLSKHPYRADVDELEAILAGLTKRRIEILIRTQTPPVQLLHDILAVLEQEVN
jgi:DNA-binding transcriptional LysR family regulator